MLICCWPIYCSVLCSLQCGLEVDASALITDLHEDRFDALAQSVFTTVLNGAKLHKKIKTEKQMKNSESALKIDCQWSVSQRKNHLKSHANNKLSLFRYSRSARHCVLFKSPLQNVGHKLALRLPDTKSVRSLSVHVASENHWLELHDRRAEGRGWRRY